MADGLFVQIYVEREREHMYWWIELGYPPFAPGKDGFPRTGGVVKHYRGLKMDEKGKAWTQKGLARVLNITEHAVRDLENRGAGMDTERRRFLCKVLDIPPVLLGVVTLEEIVAIVEQRRAAQVVVPVVSTAAMTARKLVIDAEEYSTLLTGYWTIFIGDPAHSSIADVLLKIDALYHELPHVRDKKPIAELLCRYHDFVANFLCDRKKYDEAIVHCKKALRFAEQSDKDDLKALVLYNWGYALWLADRFDEALHQYEEARRYERSLPTNLKGSLLLEIGSTEAQVARTKDMRQEAIALVDRVGSIVRRNPKDEDPYFLNLNINRYYLIRALSLIAVGQNRDAINELKLVRIDPEYPRGQAYIDIFEAQARANLGEYEWAVELAEAGLAVAQKINSEANIARVVKIHQQLQRSSFKNNPGVARLDYLLKKR